MLVFYISFHLLEQHGTDTASPSLLDVHAVARVGVECSMCVGTWREHKWRHRSALESSGKWGQMLFFTLLWREELC